MIIDNDESQHSSLNLTQTQFSPQRVRKLTESTFINAGQDPYELALSVMKTNLHSAKK